MKNILKIAVVLLVTFMAGTALSARFYYGPYYGHHRWVPVNYGWGYHHYYYHRGGWVWIPAHWVNRQIGWVPGHWRYVR